MSIDYRMVTIGASAGGIEALSVLLEALDPACRLPIVIVLHVPTSRNNRLLELMRSKCRLPICEVEDKQPLLGGHVFLAPPDYHVLVEDEESLALSNDVPVHYSRPSIDVLFESAVDVFGDRVIGVILTGANSDGAAGLAAIVGAGGMAIVQNPRDAHSPVMPKAARRAAPSAMILDLPQISETLNQWI